MQYPVGTLDGKLLTANGGKEGRTLKVAPSCTFPGQSCTFAAFCVFQALIVQTRLSRCNSKVPMRQYCLPMVYRLRCTYQHQVYALDGFGKYEACRVALCSSNLRILMREYAHTRPPSHHLTSLRCTLPPWVKSEPAVPGSCVPLRAKPAAEPWEDRRRNMSLRP